MPEPSPPPPADSPASTAAAGRPRSYAAVADPNIGTELRFIEAHDINGSRVPSICMEDVKPELEYWSTAIICTVLGANPPLDVIHRYVKKLWAAFIIDQVIQVRRGVFLVRFNDASTRDQALARSIYFFDRKPFIVRGWNPDLALNTDSITSLPLWVQLPDLELKYWGTESLSKICSVLGVPMRTDKYTRERSMIRYARVLVDMPMEGPFPDHIDFLNESGVLVRQQVHYEWIPTKCSHCHLLGHTDEVCRKKKVRQEWRPIAPQATPTQEIPNLSEQTPEPTQQPLQPPGVAHASAQSEPSPISCHVSSQSAPAQPAAPSSVTAGQAGPDSDGFTPVTRRKSQRPTTRSQVNSKPQPPKPRVGASS